MLAPSNTNHFKDPVEQRIEVVKTGREISNSSSPEDAFYESGKTILDLLNERINVSPQNIAIVDHETSLTYQQLDQQSNQLAHFLVKKGIVEESCVPICTQRTINMIVGLLGVLKAGGVYVPIDPDYPQSRIQYQLDDIHPSIIITDSASRHKLPQLESSYVFELDTSQTLLDSQPIDPPTIQIIPNSLAYVIYTSGSTGEPKGVMIEHKSVYVFIKWCQREFASSNFDIVYAVTSLCFDLSIFEIFYPLSVGKKIRLLKNGLQIEKYLFNDSNVLLNTVPSMIDSFLKRDIDLSNVTVLNMAGEAIPMHLLQKLDTNRIETRNLYGPTEDTVYSSVYRLRRESPILIGKPISNTKIYILDSEQKMVATGVEGEIYIAGDGLARGYLNKEALTREKFVRNPFDDQLARMYKTGDIGRWKSDGNIEFLGRRDHQVKIRGFRIELSEIEHVLEANELVQQAVVTGEEDENGNKSLVAYIIPKGNFNKEKITNFLKGRLPEYMVPSVFVIMDEMPLTLNGKIDHKQLPKPFDKGILEASYEPPHTKIEYRLIVIWQDLLGINKIGIHDDFFELGGNSILSVQVVSRARRVNLLLQPVDLYLYPTVAKLTEIIIARTLQKQKGLKIAAIVPFQKYGDAPPLFLIPGFWLYRKLAAHITKYRPFYGFEPYDYEKVHDIANHFLSEMRQEQPAGPYFLGAFCEHYPIAFEMAHKLIQQGEKVPLLVLIEAYAPNATLSMRSSQFMSRKLKFYAREMKKMSFLGKLKFIRREIRNSFIILYSKIRPEQKPYKIKTYPGNVALFRSSIVAPSFTEEAHMGWQRYVEGKIETVTIEGDHFGILEEPSVKETANKLNAILNKYAE